MQSYALLQLHAKSDGAGLHGVVKTALGLCGYQTIVDDMIRSKVYEKYNKE